MAYATGHFGKWHPGGRYATPFGFDKFIGWGGTNDHGNYRYSFDGASSMICTRRYRAFSASTTPGSRSGSGYGKSA